ncbi:MAG: HAD-IA family hydrolase, partial [Paracoccaceae bacterium]|nr:HAD-IA family hydrolase [Paracoccaceae bacterium]
MKSLVFDLDGTLADTSRDLICAANSCFINQGIEPPLDHERDKLIAFNGGKAMLKLGYNRIQGSAPESLIDKQYQNLLDHYESALDIYTTLYDRVQETLEEMKTHGWILGVCTNKPEKLALKLLESLGIMGQFEALTGADTYPFRKPDPRALTCTIEKMGGTNDKAILVGDSKTDLNTGRA